MAEPAPKLLTVEEFLAWQQDQDELYEFVEGRVVPRSMTGATQRHDKIVINAILALGNRLDGGPCRPMTPDIATRTRSRRIRRPDMTIDCSPLEARSVLSAAPVLILEVLSPSTEKVDTIIKVDEYKALPSLRHILIAEPDAPHVLHYWRESENAAWSDLDHIGLDTVIDLPALSCTLALAELYKGVPLTAEPG